MSSEARDIPWLNVGGRGSAEHYWHFLFGYLAPIALTLSDAKHTGPVRLHDCGPVMNAILSGFASTMGISDVQFDRALTIDQGVDEFLAAGPPQISALRSAAAPRWDAWIKLSEEPGAVTGQLARAAEVLKTRLVPGACCSGAEAIGRYLILRRSAEPEYYRRDGTATKPTYGTGRRAFLGLEEGSVALRDLGYDNLIYEPGAHSLGCQIAHFAQCVGVIGVRGAEFANTLWLPSGATVVLVHSSLFKDHDAPQRTLSKVLGHPRLIEVPHEGVKSPVLNAQRVATAIA
ncbi:MAG: DUF563 domain-containing protein [Alphaproteobacteria bacterium]|nr:MAG: DUF563 domain-containing protein [Alphaproteobacteria bacterium]